MGPSILAEDLTRVRRLLAFWWLQNGDSARGLAAALWANFRFYVWLWVILAFGDIALRFVVATCWLRLS